MKYIEKFENFQKENITFEIIDYNYNGDLLLEEHRGDPLSYYDQTVNGKINYIILNQSQIQELKTIKSKIDNYLLKINNFEGIFINEVNNQIIKKQYEINYSNHWIRKFLRKDIEDPNGIKGIKKPNIYEGINLIYNNKNTITKYIHNKVIKNDFRVLAKSTNSEGYELIFEIKNTHKKKFKITFITQTKGVSHNYNYNNPNKNPINKIIKLNP